MSETENTQFHLLLECLNIFVSELNQCAKPFIKSSSVNVFMRLLVAVAVVFVVATTAAATAAALRFNNVKKHLLDALTFQMRLTH